MKTVLIIDHIYHKKTKSTDFLTDILKKEYFVERVFYSPFSNTFNKTVGIEYDVLILFQMPLKLKYINEHFKYKQGNFFPMYDGCGEESDEFWLEYKSFNIINFSRTLHSRLKDLGLSSYYIQFFLKPYEVNNFGNKESAFFWQRVDRINSNYLNDIFDKFNIKNVHIHMDVDPDNHELLPIPEFEKNKKYEYSRWFEKKDQLIDVVSKSAFYFAPRAFEGIGMSFLDAMANGRCVVALNKPTMNEYIVDGENGILFSEDAKTISSFYDIEKIQKNTIEYIRHGYEKWEKEKNNINQWIQNVPVIDKKRIKRVEQKENYEKMIYVWHFFILGKTKQKEWYVFGKIKIWSKFVDIFKKFII